MPSTQSSGVAYWRVAKGDKPPMRRKFATYNEAMTLALALPSPVRVVGFNASGKVVPDAYCQIDGGAG